MKTPSLVLVGAGFFLALALGLAPFYLPVPSPDPGLVLSPGRLDARNAERPERIPLIAEWLGVWGRIIAPDKLPSISGAEPVRLPSAWNDLRGADGKKRPAKGCATYYLDVELPDGLDAVSISCLETAYRLYANGELIASNGIVSEDPLEGKAQRLPLVAPAGGLRGRVRFVLQVSNYHSDVGGPVGELILGRYLQLRAAEAARNLFNAAVTGACGVMALYHFLVFLLRKKDRKRFFLAIFCGLSSFRIVFLERFFEIAYPDADLFLPLIRLSFAAYYAAFPVLVLFVRARFPRSFPRPLAGAAAVTGGLFALAGAIAPLSVVQALFFPYAAYALASAVVCAMVIAKAVRRGARAATWAALGFMILVACAVYDVSRQILQSHGIDRGFYMMPIGFTVFLLIETIAQSLDYLRLSEMRKRLAARLATRGDDLKAIVDRKTRRIKEANRRLLEANADRTAFFAAASHELRTPVTAIQLALKSVREGRHDASYDRDDPVFDVLARQAARLGLQVDSFLTYARLELNVLRPVPTRQNVGERLSYAVAGMRSLAAYHNASLEYAEPPGGPEGLDADLDPVLFDAALNNALDNALRFCEPGTAISCSARAEGKRAVIKIECRGLELGADDEARLFDWLPAAGGPGARRASGTGIGLSLARRIIESMGGAIKTENEGSLSIVIDMPVSRGARRALPPEAEPDAPAPLTSAPGPVADTPNPVADTPNPLADTQSPAFPEVAALSGEPRRFARENAARSTILVVDDDADLLSFLEDGLSRHFDVISARDGQEALSTLDRHPEIALIVSDVMMPGMDGIELCRRVRDVGRMPMPFIFLTARAMEEEMEEALHGGAVGYVVKPFAMDVLAAKAASLIEFSERQRDFLRRSIIDHLSGWDSSAFPKEKGATSSEPRRSMEDAAKALGLTGRQAEILALLVKGYTDSEIASYCGISTKTVSDHVRNILDKANVENRTQLAYELLSGGDVEA